MALGLALAVLSFLVGPIYAVRAQGKADWPALNVDWSGSACPRPAALEADVHDLLGDKRWAGPTPTFHVEVLAAQPSHQGILLRFAARRGVTEVTRQLEIRDCLEAQQAVGMLIALVLAPATGSTMLPKPAATPQQVAQPPEDSSLRRAARAPSASGGRVGVSVGLGAELALLPRPALQLALGGLWALRGWRLELFANGLGPVSIPIAGTPSAAMGFWALGLGARSCLAFAGLGLRFGPCIALRGGVVVARTQRLRRDETGTANWADVSLGALLEWPLNSNLALQGLWSVAAGLARPEFRVTNAVTRHVLGAITSHGAIGLILYL